MTFHPRFLTRAVDHRGLRQLRLCAVPRPPESNKENAAPFRVDRDLALELTDAELAFIEDTEAAHSPPALQAHVKDTKAG